MSLNLPVISSSTDSTGHYLTPAASDPATDSDTDNSASHFAQPSGDFVGL